jgi:competence protein ComEC
LSYGAFSALLPTAAGPAVQQALLQDDVLLTNTVLLIPRQAEENALDERFLQAVRPAVVIASIGAGYHQNADARTLALVRDSGFSLCRTDQQGTVEVVSDGHAVWVRTER